MVDLEQWQGDWTEGEIRDFCLTAQKFGCGDKWGLFSTYIPHRVGYQVCDKVEMGNE